MTTSLLGSGWFILQCPFAVFAGGKKKPLKTAKKDKKEMDAVSK